jgi:hypothetical protein
MFESPASCFAFRCSAPLNSPQDESAVVDMTVPFIKAENRLRLSRPARNVSEQIKIKGGKHGNTNWIGSVGWNSETGKRDDETWERRV